METNKKALFTEDPILESHYKRAAADILHFIRSWTIVPEHEVYNFASSDFMDLFKDEIKMIMDFLSGRGAIERTTEPVRIMMPNRVRYNLGYYWHFMREIDIE